MALARKIHHHLTEETSSITFRYPSRLIKELEAEAQEKEISVNVLTKQILEKFVRWDRAAKTIGMIQIPMELLSTVGHELKGEMMMSMVDVLHSRLKDWVMYMKGGYDLKRVIETLEDYMRASGMSSDHRVEGDLHHFVIQHNLGIQWSLFAELLLKKIIYEFFPQKVIKFRTTENTIVATVALGSDFDEHNY
ncbi:MAG TPA: hypothetical protein VLD38_07470 [Nitrosopumilaceae archaeon]|nr:hypothetical protein [Nitrosopumilaceae archaeon]